MESAVQRYVDEHYAQSLRAASAEIENADADSVSTLADSMHSASFVSSQELQEVGSPAVSVVPKSSETPDSVKTESEVAQEPAEPKESEHQTRAEEELLPEPATIDPSMIHSHAIIDYDAYDMMLSGTLSSNSTSGTNKEVGGIEINQRVWFWINGKTRHYVLEGSQISNLVAKRPVYCRLWRSNLMETTVTSRSLSAHVMAAPHARRIWSSFNIKRDAL